MLKAFSSLGEGWSCDSMYLPDAEGVSTMGEAELCQHIIDYKDNLKRIKEEQDNAKEVLKSLETELIERFSDEGKTSVTYIDRNTGRKKTLFLKQSFNPIARFSYTDDEKGGSFKEFLKAHEYEFILDRTPGEIAKAMRGSLKEMVENNDGEVPEGWDEFFDVMKEYSINYRTGQ